MQKINLVYEDDYDDVDILLVPDYVAEDIQKILQEFFDWVAIPENGFRFKIELNGEKVLSIDTSEVVWWLENHVIKEGESVEVLKQHTTFCPEYPRGDL